MNKLAKSGIGLVQIFILVLGVIAMSYAIGSGIGVVSAELTTITIPTVNGVGGSSTLTGIKPIIHILEVTDKNIGILNKLGFGSQSTGNKIKFNII